MSRYKFLVFLLILPFLFLTCSGKKEDEKRQINVEAVSWPIFRGDSRLSGTIDPNQKLLRGVQGGSFLEKSPLGRRRQLLWTYKTGSEIISSPVIGFGRVYIGSTDGKVYAINLKDGSKVWEFDTEDDIEASPLLVDTFIYIGNLSGEFFAMDAHTGKVYWKYNTEGPIYGSANWVRKPDSQETLIFVGSHDNKMYCFDAASGELQWAYETSHYINGTPALDGENIVFGGCDEKLHILSALDGKKKGEVRAGSYIPGSAALVENRAYVGHYGNQLICIDIKNKKIAWEYGDKKHGSAFFSSPAVGKDHVVIGSRDGYLHCVNRETGEKIWTFRTRDEVDSSPVIVGNQVIAGSSDGRLYIVNLKNGEQTWSYEIGAAIISCPAVAGGLIVIGAEDGRIYAFGEGS
ncbi:MAG: PQQ-binding-like beta-propeller repeat protein [Candidatus Aminicenantes bacterium]|nr:PQQ-binding-like beta-propeller repeat protein [Candidatus Aminicenantes bacterium]NIM81023.1 PQQ-binding-like beta-propeller repeat protein [Candidatus Aminicenantes bacterium]NIN20402.1 PQQ-binding-like beta-propeller repeat protein [Candidatus Aminicenantes bacterium]NIN44175.1 PQQ-binding-like beta-propeller repeat protein [Candidatus Aminicenantes bacterium]NIN86993.1 PQQ-binding-like beta-propeller repeat protein [Candidatus Aminicenantes bacterium]